MTATNLDAQNLLDAPRGGVIREDVMEKIWLADSFPLPFTDICSKAKSKHPFREFVTDELGAPVTDNKVVDGADIDQNDTVVGERAGNYHQTAVKGIQISKRANATDSIGRMGSLGYQVSRGQQRLRRDVEAQMTTQLPSIAGDSASVAGQSAGYGAIVFTNMLAGVGAVKGGFNPATGLVDAPTPGAATALSEKAIRDVAQLVYEAGGNTKYLMSTPTVIRLISEYLFSGSARVATMTNQDTSKEAMTAYGSSNVFITDFGQVLVFKDNRMMQETAPDVASLFFIDPAYVYQSFLTGYNVEPLGKTGLSEKRLISCDYSLLITNEKTQGQIIDIDTTAPMVAG